mmetsp:Transcript_30102/g.82711  ORF Transcript_30102/g.82711 Transcript_30102/m.82711 type:complete len:181 (-) Transcript_30102:59-601(-)
MILADGLRTLFSPLTFHFTFKGGGPALLLDNPSVGLMVVFAFLNVVAFVVGASSAVQLMMQNTCVSEPLISFMGSFAMISFVSSAYHLYLAFVVQASDMTWSLLLWAYFLINVSRVLLSVYGVFMIRRMPASCPDATSEATVLSVNCASVVLISGMAIMTNYLIYLPNFALQVSRLQAFK